MRRPGIIALLLALSTAALHAQQPEPVTADPPAVEAEAEPAPESSRSPWVAAAWLPLRTGKDEGETADGEAMSLDFGMGVALFTFDPIKHPRLWRLVPAAFTLGTKSIAAGPAWIISARNAEHVTAIGGGLGVPWDEHGVYWDRREKVVGITRTMDFGRRP